MQKDSSAKTRSPEDSLAGMSLWDNIPWILPTTSMRDHTPILNEVRSLTDLEIDQLSSEFGDIL